MRHFKTTWKHLRRAPYQALVAVVVISLTFYLASIFALLVVASQIILGFFESKPEVTAFFKDEVQIEQVKALQEKLDSTGKVASIRYVSKEEALRLYQEQNKADPSLLEMVTASILPASIEVSTKDLSDLSEIASVLKQEPGVADVVFQEDIVQSLQTWTTNVRRTGLELVGSLGLISFLVTSLIIGVKVVLRKEEIEILQLIGASRWYIRLPFVLEGMIYGVVGGFIGWGLAYLRILYLAPTLTGFLQDTPVPAVPPIAFMLALLGVEVLLGIIIGMLGSFLALRRYFK